MKVYGPFHALNNPLVAIALGLRGAEDAMQVYDRYKEAHKNDFLTKALLTGQPVTELPGGPFRQLASKVTGGLIHPNVEASGTDLANEILALRKQEGENIKEAGSVANIRKNVGAEPFRTGTPLARTALRLGLGDISGPTSSEEKDRLTQDYRERSLALRMPEAAGERARASALAAEPIRVRTAGEEAAERLKVAGSPLGISTAGTVAGARATATKRAAIDVASSTKLADSPNTIYYDPTTLRNVSSTSPEMTVGEARRSHLLPIKAGSPDDRTIHAAISATKELDAMYREIPDVFPIGGSPASLKAKGYSNFIYRKSNPKLNAFYSHVDNLISYVRAVQGRYPSTTEINLSTNFWPDPGSNVREHSLLGFTGLNVTQSDTQQDARQKVTKLRQQILDAVRGGVIEGIPENEDADIDTAIDSATMPAGVR